MAATERVETAAMGIHRSSRCSCMGNRCSRPEAHTSLSNSLTALGLVGTVASVPGSWVLVSSALALGSVSWGLAWGSASWGLAWALGQGLIPGGTTSSLS